MKKSAKMVLMAGLVIFLVLAVSPACAGTTQIHVIKYAKDGTTVLNETTVMFEWLEANLPVYGDGVMHFYNQGPVFLDDPLNETREQELRLNPGEDINIKDLGAVKGTNLRDICNLVGGMNAGEELILRASDGLTRRFAYKNVYEYDHETSQGPIVITWYYGGSYVNTSYPEGMKLVFFADDHIMGNYDWHESADPKYWYFYVDGNEKYPTTSGLSVKYISEVLIYSDDAPPSAAFTAAPRTGTAPLTVQFIDRSANAPTSWRWNFGDGSAVNSTRKNPVHTFAKAGTYTISLNVSNSAGYNRTVQTKYIIVTAPAPVVTGITPSAGIRGKLIAISNLSGSNFTNGTKVFLNRTGYPLISATNVTVVSAGKISCTFPIPASAPLGLRNVDVRNINGKLGSKVNAFMVRAPAAPTVNSLQPKAGKRGSLVTITNLSGTGFVATPKPIVQLQKNTAVITATNVTVVNSRRIICTFKIPSGAATGLWNASVKNGDNQKGAKNAAFTVTV